jgi:type IV fimbrial biogenesis protein FimT
MDPRHLILSKNRAAFGRGFTLLETLATLVILAIIIGIGIPSMRWVILNQKVRNASFDLSTALMMARSEATKRHSNVSVNPVNTKWENGWTVTAGTTTLRQQDAYADIVINGNVSSVTYGQDGRLTSAGTPPVFKLSSTQSTSLASPRCVSIDLSGRVTNTC